MAGTLASGSLGKAEFRRSGTLKEVSAKFGMRELTRSPAHEHEHDDGEGDEHDA